MTAVYHVITPGDHFSPRTGSAVPTVVHGLASGATRDRQHRYQHRVVLQRDTYQPRYESAPALEFEPVAPPSDRARVADGLLARVGIPRRASIRYFRKAVDRVRGEQPGIVIAHNAPVVPWMLRDQPHRTILYAHNDVLRSYGAAEASRVVGATDLVVCVSESLADTIAQRLPRALRDRVRVVGNGIDVDQFTPATEREPGPLRLMTLGRTIPEKGADIFLTAAALIPRDDLEFVVVGSHGFDPHAPLTEFERELRRLGDAVRSPVQFQGFVDRPRLPSLLRRADILVVPSRWAEPWALTVGEGLATGLPVVAADRGGIPQALGGAGILFDPARPQDLAAEINALVDDPERRAAIGVAARASAEQRDWRWAWAQLAEVLDELEVAD